jgi:hypothetical protein
MSFIFMECRSLTSIPDIYKWKLDNILNINLMLYNCVSLSSLPDMKNFENADKIKQKINTTRNCFNAINFYKNNI